MRIILKHLWCHGNVIWIFDHFYDFPEFYNKNKWVSAHSVEIMWIVFVLGYFMSPAYFTSPQDISLPKTMNMISTDDHHELVLVFMPYYCRLDVDFNGLCV